MPRTPSPVRSLLIASEKQWKEVKEMLAGRLGKMEMTAVAEELTNTLPGPYRLVKDGKPVSRPEQYIPQRKLYTFKSAELAGFLAVFLHHPDNLRSYLDAAGEDLKLLCSLLTEHRCIGISRLGEYGLPQLTDRTTDRWNYHSRTKLIFHPCWFMLRLSYGPDSTDHYHWHDGEYFVLLRTEFRSLFAAALDMIPPGTLRDAPPEDTRTVTAETEALAAYPVFQGALRQDILKFGTFKVTAASSKKVMKMIPVPDITLQPADAKEKYNLGQLYFPLLEYAISRAPHAAYPEVVRICVEALFGLTEDATIPMLLPAVKGFTRTKLYQYSRDDVFTAMEETLAQNGRNWLDLFPFFQRFVLDGLYSIDAGYLDNVFMQNHWTGMTITLGDLDKQIDYPLMQAICAVLYALGAAELALEEVSGAGAAASPYGHICGIRLTALGRYAFCMEDQYSAPEAARKALFELDPDRLIIRSLEPGNPYEGLLVDIAVPIGNSRFRMSPESFLKRCSTKEDVEEKARFFHDFICAEPPAVWKEFFDTIARRCRPLKTDRKDYAIYTLDPTDTHLTGILCSDPQLKSIIIRAEGYRILVPGDKQNAFIARLKTFGYLL